MKTYKAVEYNSVITSLPIAEECKILVQSINNTENALQPIENFKAIRVNGVHVVDVPKKGYTLIQHRDAFRPVIEGLTQAGLHDWNFSVSSDMKRAALKIFTTTIHDNKSRISLGFEIQNSFDRSTNVNYGLSTLQGKSWIEIVGYRQICSNGAKIRVPLHEAEFVTPEVRTKLETLFTQKMSFRHTKSVNANLIQAQYLVEAMGLLIKPLQKMIEVANHITIKDIDSCKTLIEKHFRQRMAKHIIARYNSDLEAEGNSLWALYQAMTYEASHDRTFAKEQDMLDKSADFLQEALVEMRI